MVVRQDADKAARVRATAVGFSAVLMWALLALFTAASGAVPPFQLAAMSFAVGAAIGLVFIGTGPSDAQGGGRFALLARQPWSVWLFGVAGLFGYHFFYFTALRNAPPVEAGLIAYLWPLLIILFSAALPGERFGWHHLLGGTMGLAGATLIVTGGGAVSFEAQYAFGYAAALVCALVWSTYSVGSRFLAAAPTAVVAGFCAVTAVLAALCHVTLEVTVWPADAGEWLAVLGLGLGPVGAAFYTWDHGVKHGDIQVLGASSYAAPLLSTIVLVVAGYAAPTWTLALACVLITGGAALAAKDLLRRA